MSSSDSVSELFSIKAVALVQAHCAGSFAATRTFQCFRYNPKFGSPANGKAAERNFKRRKTLSSNPSQPFVFVPAPLRLDMEKSECQMFKFRCLWRAVAVCGVRLRFL